jgi:DNA polymerase-1
MLELPSSWVVDFEYQELDGERPEPVCLVALELQTWREISLWHDEMGPSPPYDISKNSLLIAFSADAEMKCHLSLGWKLPTRVLDTRIEFLQAINFTPPPVLDKASKISWGSLEHALIHSGLDPIDTVQKKRWRSRILQGWPFTAEERAGIKAYCRSDVLATARLFFAMIRRGDVPLDHRLVFALHRGRYMRAVARMEFTGVPVNLKRYDRLVRWEDEMKMRLIDTLGRQYGVFDEEGCFSHKLFARYVNANIGGWPQLESGRADTKQKTFKKMAQLYPQLEPLRQLKYCQEKLKLGALIVGRDGFNRYWIAPCASRTSRNQPSNSRSIFGPAVYLRDYLIQAPPGWAVIYLDWIAQEFGIMAGLSGDPAMLEAYRSGDIYLAFGKQAGVLPSWATNETHGRKRDLFKVCVLATQYGQKYKALAEQINQPDILGRQLLAYHHKIYRRFWEWSDNRVNRALLHNEQQTVFGWTHRFKEFPKINSVRNFDAQANGAEMLRLACCLGTEGGIKICAPVHDAILMMAPLDRLDEDVAKMRLYMAEASRIVLNGFQLRTEQHVFPHPQHYSDPKGRGRVMLEMVLKLLDELEITTVNTPTQLVSL